MLIHVQTLSVVMLKESLSRDAVHPSQPLGEYVTLHTRGLRCVKTTTEKGTWLLSTIRSSRMSNKMIRTESTSQSQMCLVSLWLRSFTFYDKAATFFSIL